MRNVYEVMGFRKMDQLNVMAAQHIAAAKKCQVLVLGQFGGSGAFTEPSAVAPDAEVYFSNKFRRIRETYYSSGAWHPALPRSVL